MESYSWQILARRMIGVVSGKKALGIEYGRLGLFLLATNVEHPKFSIPSLSSP